MRKRLLNLCLTALFSVVSTAAWALSDVNGVYQISSAADWEEFAALVNGGEVNACAVLTADIDLGMNSTMIGVADQQGKRYDGTFDGQGHSIKINLFPDAQDAGPFRYLGWRGIIQNLKVEGTITTASNFAAGIVGRGRGIIRDCWIDVTIKSSKAGDATHGGVVGIGYSGTIVENCLVQTAIVGETTQNCGGVVGWAENPVNIVNCLVVSDNSHFDISNGGSRNIARNDSRVKAVNVETYNQDIYANRPGGACYNNYVTNQWGTNEATTVVATEDLADGRICYQLNNDQSRIAWVQKIGTDAFPVPAAFGNVEEGQVYASAATGCDGKAEEELTFSNEGTAQAEAHEFDMYGVCSKCGMFNFHYWEFDDPTKFDQASRAVFLKSKEDIDVAEGMNRVCNGFKLNMKMVNDIEYIAEEGKYIFNANDWIDGNFDGGGNVLTIEITNPGNYASFMPQGCATFENVIMHGTIKTANQYAGSISGEGRQTAIRNVFTDINIISSRSGDNTSGGLVGMIRNVKTIENCIYAGDFTVPENSSCARIGGFAGWAHTQCNVKNSAFIGHLNGAGDQSAESETENSSSISRNWGNIVSENVYVLHPLTGRDVKDQDKYTVYDNEEGIADGEFAFFLNGKQSGVERFFQRIGTDAEPLPIPVEGGIVYAAASSYNCDGTPVGAVYQNTPAGEPDIPDHEYVDGFCKNCDALQEGFMTPVDGWYEIGTPAQFIWWSNWASKHLDASAKLTDDIDLYDYNEYDENTGRPITPKFAQVGSEYAPFYGNFDGQRHTISNLNINLLGKRGCGLISVMNSQPEAGFGGISDADARAAEGVYVKDVVLDESCSITGGGYTGIVGMGSPWAGHITITGCMNLGDVYVVAGTNGAGIYGCSMGSACRVTISFCGMIGDIHVEQDTRTENGSFSGWLGNYAEVSNCFALGTVDYIDTARGFARHPNSSQVSVTNCYALDGVGIVQNNHDGSKEDVTYVTMDALSTGEVTWGANGKQFRDPVWYQTLGEDDYPYPFDTHGVVIYGGYKDESGDDVYFSIPDEDLETVASSIQEYEEGAIEDVVATQTLLEEYKTVLDALTDATTILEFADALDSVASKKAEVEANAKVYAAYVDKCEEVKAYLAAHDDFAGDLRTALEYYLDEGDEPSEDNPLGTYAYIIENHIATAEEIAAETERVANWLQLAISGGYIAGTDVSSLIPNGDFTQKNQGWTGGWANDWEVIEDTQAQNGKVIGVEAWNVTGDMFQTVEGMKPGYYLVGINAAFRPSNNRYSTNYAAGIYANGIFNYFPTAIEDPVAVEVAQDGVNCNLTIKSAYDLAVFEDGFSTSEDQAGVPPVGYVVHGPVGMAYAANVGRYQAYTIAQVGEDGKLTIGIKNPGTHYSNDWTGWGALKVVYCGEEDEMVGEALDKVLKNMSARANTLIQYHEALYEEFEVKAPESPNFPAELKTALEAVVAQVAEAETVEAKAALAAKFSELFENIYEGKQAYVSLANAYDVLNGLAKGDLPVVEKDEETGEWNTTGENVLFSEEDLIALEDISYDFVDAYVEGSYSTEEALNAASLNIPELSEIIPAKDEDGFYLVGTPKQFVAYRAIASEVDAKVKAKLTADVDMTGIAMQPIGHNRSGENAVHIYRGVLDGQGHTLGNVYISEDYTQGDPATLFYELKGSTVKNLKLTGEYFNTGGAKFMGGLTRWTSESSTIDNCEIAVVMHSFISGDGTHGGVIGISGDGTTINNCLVNVTMIGENEAGATTNCGGVCGWANNAPTINNTLIISQYQNIAKGDNSNVIGRNGYTANNVFYIERSNPGFDTGGTLATQDQLVSGELTWKLNGNTADNAVWFQTLGEDANPRLFDGATVYYYGGKYINEKPNPQLNAFAYNLVANKVGSNVVVNYDLNAEAEGVEVQFFDGDELVYTAVSDEVLTAGSHKVTVPVSEIGAASNFKVSVTGKSTLDVVRVGDPFRVWGPYGMAVNNNPASKNFGQVLIAESYPTDPKDAKYISCEKNGAIFAFDQNFQPINSADGTPGFYGDVPFAGEEPLVIAGSYKYDFKDIRFTADNRLFVARANGKTNSSVWEINPENLDEPWKPVFTGGELDEATGITYVGDDEQNRAALSLAFEGAGEDLKMYVLGAQRSNGGNNTTDYNCSIYDLGTATEWTGAPSANFEPLDGVYTYSPYNVGIQTDGQGGLWYIQHVSSPSAEHPILKHFDAEGFEDYSKTDATLNGARIAVTTGGDYIAMPNGSGKIVLYECNYVPMENGKIFLNPKYNFSVGETSISCLAFDYANNLYVASAGSETFSRYATPTWNKTVVTPGNGIGTSASITGDLNGDGKVDIADAVSVLNIMAAGEYNEAADLNGDQKIDIADFVSVLNIMAAQ